MKGNWKYILPLIATFVALILFQIYGPKPLDWTHSYEAEDKIPYGNYILYTRLNDLFPGKKITAVEKTVYETIGDSPADRNYIFINDAFKGSRQDCESLLEFVSRGNMAFIACQEFPSLLTDTFHLEVDLKYVIPTKGDSSKTLAPDDSIGLRLVKGNAQEPYFFNRETASTYFTSFDSLHTEVLGRNQFNDATLLEIRHGKGSFFLSCTPLVYTNYNMLHRNNAEYIAGSLSFLPVRPVLWDEYYQRPRKNTETPLRFILSQEPLRWAYFMALAAIVLFIAFEAKRRQRIIPVIPPVSNDTLEFIQTIGKLYLHYGNYKESAHRKILYFHEYLRNQFQIRLQPGDPDYIETVSKKSGVEKYIVKDLSDLILFIRNTETLTKQDLLNLSQKMSRFRQGIK